MYRLEKKEKVEKLRKIISETELLIQSEQNKLKLLKEEYKKIYQSELPILLFLNDNSCVLGGEMIYKRFEYIYYYPDLDEYDIILEDCDNKLLPNTVDLRDYLCELGFPYEIRSTRVISEYNLKIEKAVSLLRENVNELFNKYNINSWDDLGIYLNREFTLKKQEKTLKLTK